MSLFIKKPLAQLMQTGDSEKGLKRTLGAGNLIALGIGAIIGAGLFVRTAAAAGEAAGPAVVISFIVAAVGCAFAGLCYAEFASMIPVAGSAYTYAYVTMGEFIAWIIGWALVLEYALAAATVSIAWSEYLNNLLGGTIPYQWCHSPMETSLDGVSGIVNLPALLILLILTLILIKGTKESAAVNAIIVFVKVSIVLIFIALGWQFINPDNYTPFLIPDNAPGHEAFNRHGWGGVLGGSAIVFFAFIGFDAVSTAAQEAKNPKRDMPIGILGSLVVCTLLYILFSRVLTGIANWEEFKTVGKEASVAYAIQHYMPGYEWLATLITVAILAGFSSVILVMLMGQSRVFYSMANDGLIPKVFAEVHPKFRTPYKSNMILFVFVGLFAGFIPGNMAGDLTSIGTLFAFVMVCAGIWVMRRKNPEAVRPFATPLVPLVPILGIVICSAMILSLPQNTLLAAGGWMIIGLFIYFLYSKSNSNLRKLQ
ncbi:amino acid permease [Chryseolinea soli]|uniref:Amino acid permease n=1 Tax=Chryseolinea soli TaxID=2321403 RepID=A0A385SJK6_9BACT|nr:amino acid permease [Chryseolinea soli]AYB31124.1 amino acid permease [Chryseolinea soli]